MRSINSINSQNAMSYSDVISNNDMCVVLYVCHTNLLCQICLKIDESANIYFHCQYRHCHWNSHTHGCSLYIECKRINSDDIDQCWLILCWSLLFFYVMHQNLPPKIHMELMLFAWHVFHFVKCSYFISNGAMILIKYSPWCGERLHFESKRRWKKRIHTLWLHLMQLVHQKHLMKLIHLEYSYISWI